VSIVLGNVAEHGLEINGRMYSWLWLIDHSQDEPAYHHVGRQRLVETFMIDSAEPAEPVLKDGRLILTWPDGTTATYSGEYFNSVDAPATTYPSRSVLAKAWIGAEATERAVHLEFEQFSSDDETLDVALDALGLHGFVLIDNVPLDRDGTRQAFERIGYVRKTLFGELWNLRSDGEFDDTGSTPLDISPHTDGTYSNDAPGFLGLHCLAFDAEGGNNVLVDGFNLAEEIKAADKRAYETLSTVEIPGRYIGDGGHLIARRPLVRHENGELVQVSYNNHDRAPLWLPPEDMDELYRSLAVFDEALRAPANQFEFGLRPGSMVLFDNWRALHGRRAFSGDRHLIGGYLNREDYESTIRRLAQQPLDMVVS
jgi:trimethyllysine dioxygenase